MKICHLHNSIFLHNCFPTIKNLVDSIFEEIAWFSLKETRKVVFDNFLGLSSLLKPFCKDQNRWCNTWRIWWALENFLFQLLQFSQRLLGDVWPSIVVVKYSAKGHCIDQNQ